YLIYDLASRGWIELPNDSGYFESRLIDSAQPFRCELIAFAQMIFQALLNVQSASMHFRDVPLAHCLGTPLAVHGTVCGTIRKALLTNKQSQIKLMLLAAWLVAPPAANLDDCLLEPKRSACLRQSPTRQQNPEIVRLWYRHQFAASMPLRPMFQRHRAKN